MDCDEYHDDNHNHNHKHNHSNVDYEHNKKLPKTPRHPNINSCSLNVYSSNIMHLLMFNEYFVALRNAIIQYSKQSDTNNVEPIIKLNWFKI